MLRNIFPSLIVLTLAVGGSFLWVNSQGTAPSDQAKVEDLVSIVDTAADSADPSAVPEMFIGPADAKVTVVEYASFTCPHCANFHETVFGKLKTEYIDTGKIKFVLRDVYFDRFGLWAAMIARCEGSEKYFGMTDLIFSRQKEWLGNGDPATIVENLRKLGLLAGMEEDRMNVCLKDDKMAQNLVAAFQANATKDEINATPTFVINGTKYSNMTYEDFSKILDDLLAK